jgi:hypothetical protein
VSGVDSRLWKLTTVPDGEEQMGPFILGSDRLRSSEVDVYRNGAGLMLMLQ